MSGRRPLYLVSGLFLLAFCALLGGDWYVWRHTLNSAPFCLRALERCLTFLLPGGILFLAAKACRRQRGRTACAAALAVLTVFTLAAALAGVWSTPGEPRTDVLLRNYTVAEDGRSITLETDLASSAGYLQTVDVQEREDALYLTFHGTRGINNARGARDSFPVSLPEGCGAVYVWGQGGEFHLMLQRDNAGQWRKPS